MKTFIGVVANTDYDRFGMLTSNVAQAYTCGIEKAGGVPVIIPYSERPQDLAPLLDRMGGFLFPGGIDVDPGYYHEKPIPELCQVDGSLDRFQLGILQLVLESKKPILGICRGAQLVNVAMGGSLYQDIGSQCPPPLMGHMDPDKDLEHSVDIEPGSLLYRLFGPCLEVNSRHHQAIKVPARDFFITARATDGIVEAVQHRCLPIDLVQWHPERMLLKHDAILPLFNHFIKNAEGNA